MSNEQRDIRIEKLDKIRNAGINPYPERFELTHTLTVAKTLEDSVENVKIAGRILAIRGMGKISFVRIQDLEGDMQLFIKEDEVGAEKYELFKEIFDLGDFIGGFGTVFTTKTGEKSLRVKEFTFLGKSFRPLPEKFHGLSDVETIYRQRYLDLITSSETRHRFLFRSKLIKSIRNFLDNKGFLEVETPVLQNKASGAMARPFVTHHNTYDIDMYLRISPELTLKKLVVGGYNHVYEISRNFRNEGVSVNHLQDFTMIEAYSAYFNYKDNMKLTQDLIQTVIQEIYGTLQIKIGENDVNFDGAWGEITFRDLILKDTEIDIDLCDTAEKLLKEIKDRSIKLDVEHIEKLGRGNLIDNLYKKVSRPNVIGPIFLTKHPIDLSPLARASDDDKNVSDRFQLIVNGQEIINGYSELVDPIDQKDRLINQSNLKAGGDDEAMVLDEEYILAMEYGMPPISGWGLGIDRFVQFLFDRENIRDVVLFPLLRPMSENHID